MDATIGGYVLEAGVAGSIAVNKWDPARARELKERKFTARRFAST